jgi:hypothetical protein
MKERAKAVLHLASAFYSGTLMALGVFISPLPLVLRMQVRALLIMGTTAIILDVWAAVVQWCKPPSGYILSIALHFVFAEAVVIVTGLKYMQSGSHSFISWFISNNNGFVAVLAVVRVVAGVSLLPATERRA